jgi:hypothetical protein
MNKLNKMKNPLKGTGLLDQLLILKPYHNPQLTEWGDLQDLTRGGSGEELDFGEFVGSYTPLKRPPLPTP